MIDIWKVVEYDNSQLSAYGYKIISGLRGSVWRRERKKKKKRRPKKGKKISNCWKLVNAFEKWNATVVNVYLWSLLPLTGCNLSRRRNTKRERKKNRSIGENTSGLRHLPRFAKGETFFFPFRYPFFSQKNSINSLSKITQSHEMILWWARFFYDTFVSQLKLIERGVSPRASVHPDN